MKALTTEFLLQMTCSSNYGNLKLSMWMKHSKCVLPSSHNYSLSMISLTVSNSHSESRPMTQTKSSDGGFRAGIGAICWAPISWCWYPRMLFPFFTVPPRKVQASDLYKNDPVTWRFIHKAAALALVPLTFVRIAWTSIAWGRWFWHNSGDTRGEKTSVVEIILGEFRNPKYAT